MLGGVLLRTMLLVLLAQPTLQGGTGYNPQNGAFGQMLMPFKGYNLGVQNANAYQPNIKAQAYGPASQQTNGNGAKGPYKGYRAGPAAFGNGNGAKPNGLFNGYGAGNRNAALGNGNGAKPNGPYKGYSAGPASLGNGNGAKPNGFGAYLGNRGYGASPFTSSGQQAKPMPNAGYGSKPNKPGYGAQPSYGGFGAGMRMAPQIANKGRGGYGKGNGFGQADSSFADYRNRPAAYPQTGAYGGAGYKNGAKATKTGYGGGQLVPSGQAAKTNGNGPGIGSQTGQQAKAAIKAGYGGMKGPKAGYAGYPNGGGFKGPKPGYGGLPIGYGQRANGFGGYPNGVAKAPKPAYGVGVRGASNGQRAKPSGYGVPAGAPNIKAGNGPLTNGNEKGPKVKSLGSEAQGLPSVKGFNKGVVQPAEPEPTVGVPAALPPTNGVPSPITGWKGPKPQTPVILQGYPSNPIMPEQVPVIPQNKASKPVQYMQQGQVPIPELSLIPQGKVSKPAGQLGQEILQGNPQTPIAPALLPIAQQEKAPKPNAQISQPVAPVFPQTNDPKTVAVQPAVPRGSATKPTSPVHLPVITQTKGPKPVSLFSEILQTKGPKPVAPEPVVSQTVVPPLAVEPAPALPQKKGSKVQNPDCGLGVSGQWTKLPSPGYGPLPWFPNNEGAKASKSGYGSKSKQPGYSNPGAVYGYGNGGAGQLPYNGAPIIPARLDGSSSIEPQTAELGPEVKSDLAYGGPYGAQPMGLGSEEKPQVRYGIGGLMFGGSPMGYGSNLYGNYGAAQGNPYAAQLYASKAAGHYNPLGYNASPKSAAKYSSPYTASASDDKASGKYGPYGGQLGLPVGNSGKFGQTIGAYASEPLSLSGDAKSSGKYGNPSLSFETLGPVTDGRSINQPALQYEVPTIDGVKSVDQFGEGEVQPQPIASLVDGVGEEPASYIKGGVRAEAVSLPAVPTDSTFTGSAMSLGNPAHSPLDTPTAAVTQQHFSIQQNLNRQQVQAWTGGKELKHDLKGFFGN